MSDLEQTTTNALEAVNASLTWHDISLGLCGAILAAAYGIGKFIKWFSTREIKRFWDDIDTKLDARIKESEKRIEKKFIERDLKIDKIVEGMDIIKAHYHDKSAMETGVLHQVLEAVAHMKPKKEKE